MSTGRAWSTEAKALEVAESEGLTFLNYGYTDNDGQVTWSFFGEGFELVASVTVDAETGEVVE